MESDWHVLIPAISNILLLILRCLSPSYKGTECWCAIILALFHIYLIHVQNCLAIQKPVSLAYKIKIFDVINPQSFIVKPEK